MLADQARANSVVCPDIRSKRNLSTLSVVENYEIGEFIRTTFTCVDEEDTAWFGCVLGIRKYDLSTHTQFIYARRPSRKGY